MDVIRTIKTVDAIISIAKPIIEDISKKIGPEIQKFADRLLELSEKYPSLEQWAEIIKKSAEILGDILYVLGVTSDPADELGAKVNQTDKNIDDFESVEAYIKYLHDEVALDKEAFNKLSNEEKMVYRATGMAVEASAIGEKVGVEVSADFVMLLSKIKDVNNIFVNTTELVSLISGLKDNGINKLDDVCEYFKGKGESDRIRTGNVLKDLFTSIFKADADELIENIKLDERKYTV